jgi:hypothetical protein
MTAPVSQQKQQFIRPISIRVPSELLAYLVCTQQNLDALQPSPACNDDIPPLLLQVRASLSTDQDITVNFRLPLTLRPRSSIDLQAAAIFLAGAFEVLLDIVGDPTELSPDK